MTTAPRLSVTGLMARVDDLPVLRGVDLTIGTGEIHALMGRNGSGKSSLAMTLMGNPRYMVDEDKTGQVRLEGQDLTKMTVDERARAGLYVAWQHPLTIPGVSVFTLCKTAYETRGNVIQSAVQFKAKIEELLVTVGLPSNYVSRNVNEGFSGGEKKRLEMLQMMLLKPKIVILDEIDSGLDIEALKMVGSVVVMMAKKGTSFLIITHYKKLLDYIEPNFVHVMDKGKIVIVGGREVVEKIEHNGYGIE